MKNRLVEWLDKRTGGKLRTKRHANTEKVRKREEDEADHRERELPTYSNIQTIIQLPDDRSAPVDLFFGTLPWEIRRQIMVAAFGDQLLHMDLTWNHPVEPLGEDEECQGSHCDFSVVPYSFPNQIRRNTNLPKCWQLRSCVCHRFPPPHLRDLRDEMNRPGPFGDNCLNGGVPAKCEMWPGESPSKCRVGVMGWLLSCRQAYLEGIDVLYSTNAFHMSSVYLLINLERLIPPARLASISSLEIVWPCNFMRQKEAIEAVGTHLVDQGNVAGQILDILSSAFPHLQHLVLVLTTGTFMRSPRPILEPLAHFVATMPKLNNCSLKLPNGAFMYFSNGEATHDNKPAPQVYDEKWRFLGLGYYRRVGDEPESIYWSRSDSDFKPDDDSDEVKHWMVQSEDGSRKQLRGLLIK